MILHAEQTFLFTARFAWAKQAEIMSDNVIRQKCWHKGSISRWSLVAWAMVMIGWLVNAKWVQASETPLQGDVGVKSYQTENHAKEIHQTTFLPNWESLDRRPVPQWYLDAKFGIEFHWGLYSVPAWAPPHASLPYAEWYCKETSEKSPTHVWWQFHKANYGPSFDYQEFAPMFRAELFNAAQWADLFARSGAKYIVPTSKHHDGFCLWPSIEATRDWGRAWNSVDTGPHRDLLGEMAEAVRKRGLRFGVYYSLYEWFNPIYLTNREAYVSNHMAPQFRDLVTHYEPAVIYTDGEWDMDSKEWRSPELVAWLFNESPCKDYVVINDRWGKETRHCHGGFYTTEYGAGMKDDSHPWEESDGMGYSYGYNRAENIEDYKSARQLVLMLCDLVSRGGNFFLDIGPRADGGIPVIMQERLLQMG